MKKIVYSICFVVCAVANPRLLRSQSLKAAGNPIALPVIPPSNSGDPSAIVYPNPSAGTITLKAPFFNSEKVHVYLYDSRASLVFSSLETFAGTDLQVTFPEMASGTYTLVLGVQGQLWTSQLMMAK